MLPAARGNFINTHAAIKCEGSVGNSSHPSTNIVSSIFYHGNFSTRRQKYLIVHICLNLCIKIIFAVESFPTGFVWERITLFCVRCCEHFRHTQLYVSVLSALMLPIFDFAEQFAAFFTLLPIQNPVCSKYPF